jgi:vacuolar protein sorting-associated protein 13A/C
MVCHIFSIPAHIYNSQDCVRSAPVLIQEVGTTHVRVYPPGGTSPPDLVKVVTAVEDATVFVYFTQEIGPWPFRIENDSDFQF